MKKKKEMYIKGELKGCKQLCLYAPDTSNPSVKFNQSNSSMQVLTQHLILMKDSDTVVVEEKPYPLVCPVTMELQSTIKILIEM